MAGAFSGHLIDTFLSSSSRSGPFGGQPQIATHGAMSFAPQMHGSFMSTPQHFSEPSFMDLSEESARRIATLQAKLNKKLGPEYISQRPGPGGGPKLTYAEGWKIINLANEVFGFNGWSSSVVSLTTDYVDLNNETKRYNVGVTAVVRVMLRDGVFHEDIGYGALENSKNKGAALDKCKKEAVTDGVKRALRNFGNLLGNCLYDKSYTQEVIKIRVPPPKFDQSDLHRRPEFDESKPIISMDVSMTDVSIDTPSKPSGSGSSSTFNRSGPSHSTTTTAYPNRPISAIPSHLRSSMGPPPNAASTPNHKPPGPPKSMGLQTPAYTPAGRAPPQPQPQRQQVQAQPQRVNQPPQHQPQPQARPSDRRVSFAHPTEGSSNSNNATAPVQSTSTGAATSVVKSTLEDDSFEFDDDDEFFATVDLGEGDEGLGGPIRFDGDDEAEGEDGAESSRLPHQQPPQPPGPPPQVNTNPNLNPDHRSSNENRTGSSHQAIPTTEMQPPPSSQASLKGGGGFRYPSAATSNAPQRGPDGERPLRDVNLNVNVNANNANTNTGAPSLKRSADAMQQRQQYQQRAPSRRLEAIGIGLAQAQAQAQAQGGNANTNAVKREPFRELDVEGGDAKRLRRS